MLKLSVSLRRDDEGRCLLSVRLLSDDEIPPLPFHFDVTLWLLDDTGGEIFSPYFSDGGSLGHFAHSLPIEINGEPACFFIRPTTEGKPDVKFDVELFYNCQLFDRSAWSCLWPE